MHPVSIVYSHGLNMWQGRHVGQWLLTIEEHVVSFVNPTAYQTMTYKYMQL